MEVDKVSQCFDFIDGEYRFKFSKILLKKDDQLFYTRSTQRILPKCRQIDLDGLEIHPIPVESYCPTPPAGVTVAPDPLPPDCFIKRPNLMAYGEGLELASLVLREIIAYEILRRNPHPNIAHYYGCQLYQGRVIGICLREYKQTLLTAVNPGHLNKLAFTTKEGRCDSNQADRYMSGIEEGIKHIHSLGLVHNDVNPGNIMAEEDGTAIIFDFDSILREGEPLGKTTKRTYEWHNPDETLSKRENDLEAIIEMRTWLTGTSASTFQFK